MHAECKKRSLVVNLTHEITGTDVADKRILFRLKNIYLTFEKISNCSYHFFENF